MTRPSTVDSIDPADLVYRVRADEGWVDRVESFRLRAEGRTTTARSSKFYTVEIAFDKHRVYCREESAANSGELDLRIWDGQHFLGHWRKSGQEYYSLDRSHRFFWHMLGYFGWPQAAPHPFWWLDEEHRTTESQLGLPAAFVLVGREQFRGVDCYVVENPQPERERGMFVGVFDGRKRGSYHVHVPPAVEEQLAFDLAREHGVHAVSRNEIDQWCASQPRASVDELRSQFLTRRAAHGVRQPAWWLEDWQEISRGCWIPMRMGHQFWQAESNPSVVASETEVHITAVEINRPLPDELFSLAFNKGVQIQDARYGSPLHYKYG